MEEKNPITPPRRHAGKERVHKILMRSHQDFVNQSTDLGLAGGLAFRLEKGFQGRGIADEGDETGGFISRTRHRISGRSSLCGS
jgi:hypothetical protein